MPISAKGAGRIIGVLLLMQMVGSGLVDFVLLEPAFAAPGFLVNAAGHSLEAGLSDSHPMALWFVALAVGLVQLALWLTAKGLPASNKVT
jgi:hypothetical protein